MDDDNAKPEVNLLGDLEPIGQTAVAPATGIAAIALNFAVKYHDINTIKDGQLYQQYKMEGRNMRELHLDVVFETAMKMEAHLVGADKRIANIVVEAIELAIEEDGSADEPDEGAAPLPPPPENE